MLKNRNLICYLVLFSYFLAITHRANAQRKDADSLRIELSQYQESDSMYATILNSLAYTYRRLNVDSMEILAQRALDLAKKNSFKKAQAVAYGRLGSVEYFRGNYETSIEYNQLAYELHKEIKDTIGYSSDLGNIANSYDVTGYHELAIKYFHEALDAFISMKDTFRVEVAYYNMATTFEKIGDKVIAIEYYLKSLRSAEEIKDKDGMAWAYRSLGQLYSTQRDFKKAKEYINKAFEIRQELGDLRQVGVCLLNLGDVALAESNIEEALSNYNKALSVFRTNGFKRWEGKAFNSIANSKLKAGDLMSAFADFRQAIRIFKEIKTLPELAEVYHDFGKYYLAKQNFTEAEYYFNTSLKVSKELNDNESILKNYFSLYQLDSTKGKVNSALNYYRVYNHKKDSLNNKEQDRTVRQLQIQYELEQKDKAIKSQKIEIENQKLKISARNYQLVSAIFFIILIITLAYSLFKGRLKEKKSNKLLQNLNEELTRNKEEITIQKEELQINNEKIIELSNYKDSLTGMIVHDLKNPLNNIIGLSENKERKEGLPIINRSGKRMLHLVNNILDVQKFEDANVQLSLKSHSLKALINSTIQEVDTQLKSKEIKLEINLNDIQIVVDDEIIYRVVVNLLSNAIKYSPKKSSISIKSTLTHNNFIKINIQDQGIGIPEEHQKTIFNKFAQVNPINKGLNRSTGIGLTFCQLAIESHKGEIGVISDGVNGTTFWFLLPIDPSNKTTFNKKDKRIDFRQNHQFIFTREELNYLKPFAEKIMLFEVYDFGKIKSVLLEINSESEKILHWVRVLEDLILSGDQEDFNHMLKIVLSKEVD